MRVCWVMFMGIAAACGNDGGGNPADSGGGGRHRGECEIACRAAGTPCAGQDEAPCVDDCVAWTEYLTDPCARCVIENSEWTGVDCRCPGGSSCERCTFGPGEDFCTGGVTCTDADDACSGFELAETTGSACAPSCS